MDIKDAVFSTLQELQSEPAKEHKTQVIHKQPTRSEPSKQEPKIANTIDEVEYLKSVRERLLVLFEGLQAPNNRNLEKKVDLIINFLEFQLATIEERLAKLKANS